MTLSGLFYSPVAFGTPYRFSLPAGRNGPSLRAIAHSLIDLGAVAALVRRQSHHRVMDRSIDRQHVPGEFLADERVLGHGSHQSAV